MSEEALLRRIEAVEQELRALRDYVHAMVDELHQFASAQRRRLRDLEGEG